MIIFKSIEEINRMREGGRILSSIFTYIKDYIEPGISTYEIDKIIEELIIKSKAIPSFKGYNNFPNASCISVNEVLIHGIPSKKIILKEGDIVSIDVGVFYKGFHTDAARTFPVGKVKEEYLNLIKVTEASFFYALQFASVGYRIHDISAAIEEYVVKHNFFVVREYVGHGIGRNLHEDPPIPNYGKKGTGPKIQDGMVLAIEPMILINSNRVYTKSDGWSVVSTNNLPTAHYENTVAIVNGKSEILTL
ncbi:MAG: type I methionyl aminopeptidase [Spirochaetes bacterium]|nr:type I methionyl aminopeptidase [Spirochaetota bacterium]